MTQQLGLDDRHRRAMFESRVAVHDRMRPGHGHVWKLLEAGILKHGGRMVVPHLGPEPHVAELLQAGVVLDGFTVVLNDRYEDDCHRNVAAL